MKYTTAILSSLMAATVVAQPHVRHQHAAKHEKRDIVWFTEIEMVTETVDYTTTVWVSSGQLAAPSTTAASFTPTTLATIPKSSAAASTSVPQSTAAASSSDGAVLNQKPSSSSSSLVAPPSTSVEIAEPTSVAAVPTTSAAVPTTSSTYVAPVVPTTSSTYVAPVVPTTSSTYVAPVPSSTSVAPVIVPTTSSTYVAPVPTSTYVAPVVVPTTSSVAPVVIPSSTSVAALPAQTYTPSSSSSSSSGGVCASGSPCSGDITFYAAGLGACGITTDGSTFAGVALPVGLMGAQSNGNPYCGKTITINHKGKTAQATVIDKCMGCLGNSIDLTNFVFDQLEDEAVGRSQATWFFND